MSTETLLRADETEPACSADTGSDLGAGELDDPAEVTDRLQELIERGFRFAHPRNAEGVLVAIVGIRPHHGVIDIVQLYGEDDADAARLPGDEPDVLFPRNVLWRTAGTALDVLDQMLALRDPASDIDKVRCHAGGCWMPTRSGRATWLAASA